MKKYWLSYALLIVIYVSYFIYRGLSLDGRQGTLADSIIIPGGFTLIFILFFVIIWFIPRQQNGKALMAFAHAHGLSFSDHASRAEFPDTFDMIVRALNRIRMRTIASPRIVISAERGMKIFLDDPTFAWRFQHPALDFFFRVPGLRGRHQFSHMNPAEVWSFRKAGPLAVLSGIPINIDRINSGMPLVDRYFYSLTNNNEAFSEILAKVGEVLPRLAATTNEFLTVNNQRFQIDFAGEDVLLRFSTDLAKNMDTLYPLVREFQATLLA
jgi:hypothetical protein